MPISKLTIIEDKFKININITGDYTTYTSKGINPLSVNLILQDEHYKVNYEVDNARQLNANYYTPKKLITYKVINSSVDCYDGNGRIDVFCM